MHTISWLARGSERGQSGRDRRCRRRRLERDGPPEATSFWNSTVRCDLPFASSPLLRPSFPS